MARAIWSGFLSFGLVSVPVGLYTATADQTIGFHQLHKGTSNRIRYRRVDEVTGEEVPLSDIVSGYDLGGGEYVVVTRDELREVAPGKSEQIEISDFVDLERIDPVYFRSTYYLAPRGKAADRAYALLRQAMRETSKVGIATLILRDKEHLVAVRPGDEVLILETMYFDDEIRKPGEEIGSLPGDTRFEGRELTVAKKLVESLTVDWSPGDYHNTYRARVEELIESKRAGSTVTPSEEHPKTNVIDLMTALEESIARARQQSAPAARPPAPAARPPGRPATGRTTAGSAELAALSRAELLDLAAQQGITGRSKMSKAALVEALAPAAAPKPRRRKSSLLPAGAPAAPPVLCPRPVIRLRVRRRPMPEPAAVTAVCYDCEQDLEHCHGTVLVHPDGFTECTDGPACRLGRDLHGFEAPCEDADCPCGLPEPAALPQRIPA